LSLALVLTYAESLLGTPYKWGGSNPMEGFDCSGLVVELMKSAGELRWNDNLTAQQLYDHFADKGSHGLRQPGTLAFYGRSVTEITHVGFMVSHYQMIDAGGGDRLTLTVEDAIAKNAFVRMRHVDFRRDLVGTIRPYYARIGMINP